MLTALSELGKLQEFVSPEYYAPGIFFRFPDLDFFIKSRSHVFFAFLQIWMLITHAWNASVFLTHIPWHNVMYICDYHQRQCFFGHSSRESSRVLLSNWSKAKLFFRGSAFSILPGAAFCLFRKLMDFYLDFNKIVFRGYDGQIENGYFPEKGILRKQVYMFGFDWISIWEFHWGEAGAKDTAECTHLVSWVPLVQKILCRLVIYIWKEASANECWPGVGLNTKGLKRDLVSAWVALSNGLVIWKIENSMTYYSIFMLNAQYFIFPALNTGFQLLLVLLTTASFPK